MLRSLKMPRPNKAKALKSLRRLQRARMRATAQRMKKGLLPSPSIGKNGLIVMQDKLRASDLADRRLSDDDEDPVGDIAEVKRALKLFRQREEAEQNETQNLRAYERQIETLKATMADSEADFTADHPDYQDAAKFYR